MDPQWPDCRRSPLAHSPTLRPDPRHQRVEDANNDTVIKLIKNTQRPALPDDGFQSPMNIQGSRSPIACTRKAVLPAIGVSVVISDSQNGQHDNDHFYRNHSRQYAHPPTIIVPNSCQSNNEILDTGKPSESDEASPSTSTADSGFADKESDNVSEPIESYEKNFRNRNQEKLFIGHDNRHNESKEISYDGSFTEHTRPPSTVRACDFDPDFDDSEYFPELQKSNWKNKTRSRLEVCPAEGRTRSRLASRNSVSMYEEDEYRFRDDSMLKPVNHQSVVAEDKLVSSRCRRSSKLLDKLMLSEYNSGQPTSVSFPFYNSNSSSTNSTSHKGYQSKSFRGLSNTLTMAGQILRPRNLPHLPPILKRQKTVDIPDEEHHQSLGYERPCAPSPSLTPPSPSASEGSECGEPQLEDDSNSDFIDCR